ncbi:MAG: succinate dehydrogenase cytochrome b subunit [Bacteroidaceae bacterium]|nr:succinate dehydrogenase cytochrome b subunit [Bacteroidaceae bacterium]MBR3916000.1 succinate dehydrogenase cytochrome b subunit [Bacteroidaceae bacterium]
MWLSKSSVGRKVVMSVTGAALVLFLLFHMSMNLVAIISTDGYNAICEFLGANWYALVGTAGLAALVVLHFVYAFILTLQNRKARGSQRYAVSERPKNVTWASQNMLVLGIIVVLGIGLHLFNFWAKMQLPEVLHMMGMHVDAVTMENVANGSYYIASTFSCPVYAAIYVIWLAALWFHLTHGIWSSMQTLGVNNNVWICRWKAIGNVLATIIILGFLVVVVAGYFGLGALGKIALECGAACC